MDENFGYGIKAEDWDYKRLHLRLIESLPEYGPGKWQLILNYDAWLRPIETIEELIVQLDMVSPFVMLGK